eukprot:Selendium_serpulae@DN6422_c3_g1_i1.p1
MKLVRGGVHEECWARRMLGTLENRGFVCACRERAGEILPAFIKKHKSDKVLFDGTVILGIAASETSQSVPKKRSFSGRKPRRPPTARDSGSLVKKQNALPLLLETRASPRDGVTK